MVTRPTKKRVAFKLHAPEAGQVFVAGSFDDWDPTRRPMQQDSRGMWRTRVSLEPGEHEYRFVVDGDWQDDPACEERVANDFGLLNCVIRV